VELDRSGPSYTVDTLERLAATTSADVESRPDGERRDLVLIMSAEAFRDLRSWRRPERILELARLAIVPRDGFPDAGRAFVCPRRSCAIGRRTDAPCATWCRMRSQPISATMASTATRSGGLIDRDRTRVPSGRHNRAARRRPAPS